MPKRRIQPGTAGLARQTVDPQEAYWLQNLELDRSGVWRPRKGLRFIVDLSHAITHLSRPAGYNHKVMAVANGGLYQIDVETPGSPSAIDTGWPTIPMAAAIGVTPSSGSFWCANKAGISATAGPLKLWDGTSLTSPGTAPNDGNFVAMHGYMGVQCCSGVTDNTAIRWSARGNVSNWPTAQASPPDPKIVTCDAAIPMSPTEMLLFGPQGIASIRGADDPNAIGFFFQQLVAVATPMHHVCKCGSRVLFLAAGPSVCSYSPADGGLVYLDAPIHRDLFLAGGVEQIRTWYDSIHEAFCLADLTQHLTYVYGLKEGRWLGAWTFADGADLFGQVVLDQGASEFDAAGQPWGKGFLGAGSRLVQWDPTLFVDQTSAMATAQHTMILETAPSFAGDPGAEKQLTRVQLDGSGSATVKLRYRNAPDASWTVVTLGTVTMPGTLYPGVLPLWREASVHVEGLSASGWRLRSIELNEDIVGMPT